MKLLNKPVGISLGLRQPAAALRQRSLLRLGFAAAVVPAARRTDSRLSGQSGSRLHAVQGLCPISCDV